MTIQHRKLYQVHPEYSEILLIIWSSWINVALQEVQGVLYK